MEPNDPLEPPTTPLAPPPARRFLRSHDDRVLGGVAGGLGRSFGVDPIIFRIALAALAFAGGVGILAYGAALLLVPSDDGTGQPAPREGTKQRVLTAGGGVLLVLAAIAVLSSGDAWGGGFLLCAAVVVAIGYGVVRLRGRRGPGTGSFSRLLALTAIGLAVLIGATMLFWGSAWATAAGGGVAIAVIVMLLGAIAIAGAVRGDRRARWLALPALLLAFPAGVVSAADVSLKGGAGERTYHPTGADRLPAGYRLGAGELTVDLRDLDWRNGRRVPLELRMGVGHTVVLVPESVCVGARTRIGAGYVDVLGREASGVEVDHDVARTSAAGVPRLALDVKMGLGAVEVLHRRAASSFEDSGDQERGAGRRGRAATARTADRACAGGRS